MTETRPMPETVLPFRREEPYIGVEQVAFLVANPRRGKKPWRRSRLRVFRRARSRRHRASGGFGYERRQRHWIGENVYSNVDPDADPSATPASQSRFIYDGDQIVLQFQGTGGAPLTAGNLSDRYLWGPAVDQLLAQEGVSGQSSSGSVLWALTDNQNTLRDLASYNISNGATTIAQHRVYDAFGALVSPTPSAATADCIFGYTGRPFDCNTKLQNNLTRWYNPSVGRWLSQDPIGFGGGDTDLYRYVANSPTDHYDPAGTVSFSTFGVTLTFDFPVPSPSVYIHVDWSSRVEFQFLVPPKFKFLGAEPTKAQMPFFVNAAEYELNNWLGARNYGSFKFGNRTPGMCWFKRSFQYEVTTPSTTLGTMSWEPADSPPTGDVLVSSDARYYYNHVQVSGVIDVVTEFDIDVWFGER